MDASERAARITPPRKNYVLAITTDANVRAYDISSLSMGGQTPSGGGGQRHEVYLTIQAETTDVFFYFHTATDSALSTTDAISAGGTAAYAATHSARIPAGQERTYMLDRSLDKFLVIKSTGAGICRIFAASPAE